jgi:hypothetical protein
MTPEQQQESERAAVLFQGALIALGAQATLDSLALWQDVPPLPDVSRTRAVNRWLDTAVRYVMKRRIRARDMALAFYRYQRALQTGATIALPGRDNPPYMTLPELKREFELYVNPETPEPSGSDGATLEVVPEDRIPVEEVPGLKDELDSLETQAEQQVRENLIVLGPLNQDRKTRTARYTEPEQVDEGRAKAHDDAGRRQAAAAARNVMNGARGSLFLAGDSDRRCIGFVRVSRTGTPCGFCAMLISRGPVYKGTKDERQGSLYRSNEGTGPKADGTIVTYGDMDLYHDNCQCYAIPVYSPAQFARGDIFALNRKYAELWPIVTEGLGGDAALKAWRRFIRQEAKSQKSLEAAA